MTNFYDNVSAIQDISVIVTNESARLDAKQMNVDRAYDNQKRMILLNQSYGQRMQQYTFISIVLAVTFGLIAILLYLQKAFPIIPSNVYDLVMVLLIGGVGIYIYNLYNDILGRDKLDFSKISPESPNLISPDELNKMKDKAIAEGKISNAISNTCVGQECCLSGQTYSESSNKCQVPAATAAAATAAEQSSSRAAARAAAKAAARAAARAAAAAGFTTLEQAYSNNEIIPK